MEDMFIYSSSSGEEDDEDDEDDLEDIDPAELDAAVVLNLSKCTDWYKIQLYSSHWYNII